MALAYEVHVRDTLENDDQEMCCLFEYVKHGLIAEDISAFGQKVESLDE